MVTKISSKHHGHKPSSLKSFTPTCWLTLLTIFACATTLRFLLVWQPGGSRDGCPGASTSLGYETLIRDRNRGTKFAGKVEDSDMTAEERAFWKQPDGPEVVGVSPCLEMSREFERESALVVADRSKYLMVVVNGGLNQQRNQIVDAVVMARVLGAALVVPVLEVNPIWEDESEFSDIFDLEHFKETLKDEVRIVSSLPSTHVMIRPQEEKHTPLNASPRWLREHYQGKISREGVLLLRGLDARLSKELTPDLQKLRCKAAYQAVRFAPRVESLGRALAERMARGGLYAALHLRLELDVWVRTGCLPGLGNALDARVREERKLHPWMLTARGEKLGFTQRKLAGLCPLTAAEVARFLKALGASRRTRIYWAGGEPLGKELALQPLLKEFPNLFNKESLATAEELAPFRKKASIMAAIDYLVCFYSDVFVQSHGGNFGKVMQGHRAFGGHRKHIVPKKRQMIPHFLNSTMLSVEFGKTIRALHVNATGFPFPECMCKKKALLSNTFLSKCKRYRESSL